MLVAGVSSRQPPNQSLDRHPLVGIQIPRRNPFILIHGLPDWMLQVGKFPRIVFFAEIRGMEGDERQHQVRNVLLVFRLGLSYYGLG